MAETIAIPEPGPDAYSRMFELADLLTPHALQVAVTLGIPGLIAAGVTTPAQIAERTGAHEATLLSLLRHLNRRGLLGETQAGSFTFTETGATLLHPHAVEALDFSAAQAQMDLAWPGLLHSVRTGEPGYATVHGRAFWDQMGSDSALTASFDRYLQHHAEWQVLAAKLPLWPARGTVVDIGGGAGGFLTEILKQHPLLAGILLELGTVAERAKERLVQHGATIAAGSFFDPLPAGHDIYVMAHVLHDWPDADAGRILGRIADAATPASRLLIVEQIVDSDGPTPNQTRSDLLMRLLFASGERTADQWEALLADAGFQITTIHPLNGFRSVVEAIPLDD